MATFSTFAAPQAALDGESFGRKLFHAAADFLGDIGRARQACSDYERLSHLSDAELTRRGLAREDLPRFAYDRAFGRG